MLFRSHTYTAFGNYPATLTLRNGCGFDTVFHFSVHIINIPASLGSLPLVAQKACPGDQVSIIRTFDSDSCSVDFGDGYFTKDLNSYSLNHQYLQPGTYPVKINITNSCGNKASRVDTIHILNNNHAYTAIAPFFYPNSSICPEDPVNFSCNYFPSISWNFGNGQKAYLNNAKTTYSAAGTYHYTLTVENGCGNDTTLNGNVTIGANNPVSSLYLYAYEQKTCTGSEIRFQASGNSVKISWDFGDSTTSDFITPVHTYKKEGSYNVKAFATNGCNNSKSDSIKIIISDTLQIAIPDIQTMPKKPCPGDEVYFSAHYSFNGSDNLTNYDLNVNNYEFTWLFADGNVTGYYAIKTFNQAGKYPYILKVKNKSGKEISLKDTIVVGTTNGIEKGYVSISGDNKTCLGDSAYFGFATAGKYYEVDFGDGSKTSTFTEVNIDGPAYKVAGHKYALPGIYKVKLKATNGCGYVAYDSLAISVDSYHRSDMSAYYTVEEYRSYCKGEKVIFNCYQPSNMEVDFGDGKKMVLNNTSFLTTFSHAYNASGKYNVIAKFHNSCGDTVVYTNNIYVDTCQTTYSNIETASNSSSTMRCYPNPVHDRLTIEPISGILKQETRYILYNINGTKILEGILNKESTTTEINLSHIPTGLYLLRLSSDSGTSVTKVIKE